MNTAFILILVCFILLSIFLGINRAISLLPIVIIFSLLVMFFGYFIITFFPIILIIILFNLFIKNKNPNENKRKTWTYYSYTQKDFEDMFRNQQQNSNNYYRSSGNPFESFESKDKYYEILGVSKDANPDEIKKAYRELAKKHHPDRYSNESDSVREMHEKKFKEINEAYEKLQ